MNDEKLFELITKMYSGMTGKIEALQTEIRQGFKEVNEKIRKNTEAIVSLKKELNNTKKTLYDGYVQNAEGIWTG